MVVGRNVRKLQARLDSLSQQHAYQQTIDGVQGLWAARGWTATRGH